MTKFKRLTTTRLDLLIVMLVCMDYSSNHCIFYICKIWQLDVNTKFFYEEDNQGCMEDTTLGFVDPENARNVCKLQRSIQELK
jgi:hypothetical protein